MAMLKKPIVLAIAGALAGVGAMALVYVFVLGGGAASAVTATPEPTVIAAGGKLGPRLTLEDRVFNLVSPSTAPVYAKIQTIIEFETTDSRWGEVFDNCGEGHARSLETPARVVSARPGRLAPATAPSAEEELGPCASLEAELLAEFEEEIGTGRQLIEDAVTTIVSSKTPDEVATTAGKDALKEQIRLAVDDLVHEPRVSRVLFVNFITQ
jgi:flagellar basal body-associated protein FliL